MSYKIFHRPDSNKKDENSLYPDHEVTTTYEDFKNGVDTQMEWVRKYIAEHDEKN